MQTNTGKWLIGVACLGLAACGTASTQSAESPSASETPAGSGASQAKAAETSSGASKPSPDAVQGAAKSEPQPDQERKEAPESEGLRKASRPPSELITGGNVVYVFNFKNSEAGTIAKERCEREKPDDPAGMRACMDAARSKVPVEFIRFLKTANGEFWWVTYNRYKGNLLKWHRIQFLPGEETQTSISLNLVGKDKGIAPMARIPKALSIELPNDYSILLHHPEHGAMVYDAKLGLMEAEQP